MFQLREEHINALRGTALDNFETRGVQHLRSRLPRETAAFSDEELRQRVRECIPRARVYGLVTERQVMAFADATYIAGECFDSLPEGENVRVYLDSPGLDPDAKSVLMLHSVWKQPEVNQESSDA